MKIRTTVVAAALALASSTAFAVETVQGGGNIVFSGNVSTDTCFVQSDGGDAKTINVNLGNPNLGQISESSLSRPLMAGPSNGKVTFKVQCSQAGQTIIRFAAATALTAESGKVLKINGGEATPSPNNAFGFGIALYPLNSAHSAATAHKLDDGVLFDQALTANAPMEVAFEAGYVKTSGDLKGGLVTATLPYTIVTP
ncbi:MAG: fimbrial protein [Paenalcaligenes sp.]